MIDWLLENLINKDRTQRQVMKKLKDLMLVVNSKVRIPFSSPFPKALKIFSPQDVRNEISRRLPKVWSEEEVTQLTGLWYKCREANGE